MTAGLQVRSGRTKKYEFSRWLRKRVFGISPREATFSRRGFESCETSAREHLEHIGQTFLRGYNASLEEGGLAALETRLNSIESECRGFAFEGAAMGLALLDRLSLRRGARLQDFLNGPGAAHTYMVHVGAGWTMARLPMSFKPMTDRMDSLLRWLVIDGYGFHQGYFHWRKYVEGQSIPARLSGAARRVFDQGLGRSLWFISGADVSRIEATIAQFPEPRLPDLWSGVGLACTYAGHADRKALEALKTAAGPCRSHLAQGAAFAAKTRQRANNCASHTDLACEVLCNVTSHEAARLTDDALENLTSDESATEYEVWRRRIQTRLSSLIERESDLPQSHSQISGP
ncbi:MAG: DUF1702 family protein [Blastocatellia bacterium]